MPTGISNGNSGHGRRLRAEAREEAQRAWVESLHPDAVYWRGLALGSWDVLVESVGRDEADRLTGDWNDGRSWRDIHEQLEEILEGG
jgi:hypothetical protein